MLKHKHQPRAGFITLRLLAKLAVGGGVFVAIAFYILAKDDLLDGHLPWITQETEAPPPSPEEVAAKHLDWANAQCVAHANSYLGSIDSFFRVAKQGTPEFADAAYGLTSKWHMIQDLANGESAHESYLEEQFDALVLDPDRLHELVSEVVRDFVRRVKSTENRMLTELQSDIDDLPTTSLAPFDEGDLQVAFDGVISTAAQVAGPSLAEDVVIHVASEIVGQVMMRVGTRMTTSAGILGAGAASAPHTKGVGILVAFAADAAVSTAWDVVMDPKGELSGEINAELDDICSTIKSKLRPELDKFNIERSSLRDTAIHSFITEHTSSFDPQNHQPAADRHWSSWVKEASLDSFQSLQSLLYQTVTTVNRQLLGDAI